MSKELHQKRIISIKGRSTNSQLIKGINARAKEASLRDMSFSALVEKLEEKEEEALSYNYSKKEE